MARSSARPSRAEPSALSSTGDTRSMLKQVSASHDAAEEGKWSLAEPGARRSLLLLAAGAVIGLGIAGFGLFTAKGTASHTVPPEDAALVNQQPILISDFTTQLQSEFGIPIGKATE